MRKTWIAAATISILLALGALRTVDLLSWRRQILRSAYNRSDNLAHVLSEYIRESFAAGDASMRQLAIHSQRVGGPTASESAWLPILTSAVAGLRDVGSISVVDASGTIQHSTAPAIVGQSRAGNYVFRRLAAAENDLLVVDTPIRAMTDPKIFLIPIGRRLMSDAGTFDGIVVATLLPAAPRELFRSVDVGEHGIVWVFHPDGRILFREPSENDPIGEAAAGNPVYEAAVRSGGSGQHEGRITGNGAIYVTAYRYTPTLPLIVAVSLERWEVLADWRRQAIRMAGISLALGAITLAAIGLAFHQMGVRARALTSALEAEQRARRASEEAGRLQEEFLMTVSHELRTPLQSILGWTRVLMSGKTDPMAAKTALETIERNAGIQTKLINDLLDVSRAVSGQLRLDVRPTDLGEVIRHVVQTARPAAEARHVRIDVDLDGGVPLIAGDADRLQQIVGNLLTNAVKFTPDGGAVGVTLERHGSTARIVVRDSGIGIQPEFLPHVFDRFRQADASTTRRHGGLGLGLAIVRHLTELHGGTVSADSEGRGKGATFSVNLPIRT